MKQTETDTQKQKRHMARRLARFACLVAMVLVAAALYFAALEPEASDEHRAEYLRLADQLYADPDQARRNYELLNARAPDASLGDLDLSAGVWQPFIRLHEPAPCPSVVNTHAMSILSWDASFTQLESALLASDAVAVEAALRDIFARMHAFAPFTPSTRSLSFTFPVLQLRSRTLQIIREHPLITADQIEFLAEQTESLPEIPEFQIFKELAHLEFRDTISHHYSSSGWFVPASVPVIGKAPYAQRTGSIRFRWSNISGAFIPRASQARHLANQRFGTVAGDRGLPTRSTTAQRYPFVYLSFYMPKLDAQFRYWRHAQAARVYLPIELRVLAFKRRTGEWPTVIEQVIEGQTPIDPATQATLRLHASDDRVNQPRIGRADQVDGGGWFGFSHYGGY